MINEYMYSLGARRSVIREIFEYSKKRAAEIGEENVFDFSLGNPSVEPPVELKAAITDLLESESGTSLHGYTSAQGDIGVRRAIANGINSRHATHLTPDHIYMTCGAAASLSITLHALVNPGDECIVFAPFFTEYSVFIRAAGAEVIISKPNPDTLFIDPEDLKSRLSPKTKALIVNSPNNPSGAVYPRELLSEIADILRAAEAEYGHPIYLIADEPYRELVYGDTEVPYLMNIYSDTVVCYSYSKSLSLPGERIGYIAVCPDATDSHDLYLAVCGAGRSLGYVCAPSLFQKVIERTVGVTVDISHYRKNRDILLEALSSYGYECVRPDGAFYLFVKSLEPDSVAFCEAARRHELLLVPCDDFGTPGYFRIAYCVDESRVRASLPAFKALADSYKKG